MRQTLLQAALTCGIGLMGRVECLLLLSLWLLTQELSELKKIGTPNPCKRDGDVLKKRKIYHEVRMTVNLIKMYKSKLTDKNK
jgi:hypothetical protein